MINNILVIFEATLGLSYILGGIFRSQALDNIKQNESQLKQDVTTLYNFLKNFEINRTDVLNKIQENTEVGLIFGLGGTQRPPIPIRQSPNLEFSSDVYYLSLIGTPENPIDLGGTTAITNATNKMIETSNMALAAQVAYYNFHYANEEFSNADTSLNNAKPLVDFNYLNSLNTRFNNSIQTLIELMNSLYLYVKNSDNNYVFDNYLLDEYNKRIKTMEIGYNPNIYIHSNYKKIKEDIKLNH